MPSARDCDSRRLPYCALAGIETTSATRVTAIAGYIDTRESTWATHVRRMSGSEKTERRCSPAAHGRTRPDGHGLCSPAVIVTD
jgi:hypothetical protein